MELGISTIILYNRVWWEGTGGMTKTNMGGNSGDREEIMKMFFT